MSKMGFIADYIDSIAKDDNEYVAVCKEVSEHLSGIRKLEDMSKKAFSAIMTWEDECGCTNDYVESDNYNFNSFITRSVE